MSEGKVSRVSGPIVSAEGLENVMMNEIVFVGDAKLIGEVTRIEGDTYIIQVYEDTTDIACGDVVERSGELLTVRLGPGLMGSLYDGLQRPLEVIAETDGTFIARGSKASRLETKKTYGFVPEAKVGQKLTGGAILGSVKEGNLKHSIMVPPDISGELIELKKGNYTINQPIGKLKTKEGEVDLKLAHEWPARVPRHYQKRLPASELLITGQRVLDTFFPLAKGGTVIIPGGFGTGKTVVLHQISKFANVDVVIYIGCGERGNEIATLLSEYSELKDSVTGEPLIGKSVIIANTSNMPVIAREASIYTGITIAEYYRDMGLDVLLISDSTSRWAEAMREISARQEEMPGEGGYPPNLSSKLSEFYERAGRVTSLSGRPGSVTIMGAVSPHGGDFSEPVTQKSMQIVEGVWALDADLAYRRHYPAINYSLSFSYFIERLQSWWNEQVNETWASVREDALNLLREEDKVLQIASLIGVGALSVEERLLLEDARLVKDAFLKQSAFHPIDAYCTPEKQFAILDLVMKIHKELGEALNQGALLDDILKLKIRREAVELKEKPDKEIKEGYKNLIKKAISSRKKLVRNL